MPCKRAVVTGAGGGIGGACAAALERSGWEVVRHAGHADGDLRNLLTVERLFAGTVPLHALVHCAGVFGLAPLAAYTKGEFRRFMDTNVGTAFACCRAAVARMGPGGRIILISSVAAIHGKPEHSLYAASKAALLGMARSLSAELEPQGIRVSVILPGGTDTAMVQGEVDRTTLLRPEDIAQSVLYLLGLSAHATVDELYVRRWG